MQTKNFDGIKKIKPAVPAQQRLPVLSQKVDGVIRQASQKPRKRLVRRKVEHFYVAPFRPTVQAIEAEQRIWKKIKGYPKLPVLVAAFAVVMAFTGGMWAALNTTKTEAVDQVQLQAPAGAMVLATSTEPISGDLLFNTPLQDLKNYFESAAQPDIIQKRTEQLTEFLNGMKSPLAVEAETIAQQTHWKIILAIAFAESTMGKHCYEYNCSGIGGSEIKTYSSSKQWIVDFNRLIEKRYKGDTLEEMCGVYVQPCNPNWLVATKQILSSLEEKGIE